MESWREELYHHGILGMKWGVRRYQNYDGSYTKEGLKRYEKAMNRYDTAKSKYTQTKQNYKNGSAVKRDVNVSKSELKKAKKSVNANYDQLKLDKRADKGKRLYQEGKTIEDDRIKRIVMASLGEIGTNVVGNVVGNVAAKIGEKYVGSYNAAIIQRTVSGAVKLAGTAAVSGAYAKTLINDRNLRAYYGHSRPNV